MRYLANMILLALLPLAIATPPAALLLEISGMDDECCAEKVVTALRSLPFSASVAADPARGLACVALSGPADEAATRAGLDAAGGYKVSTWSPVERCPEGLVATGPKDPWAGAEGLDVLVISRGETVDLEQHRARDRFTLVDFSAAWCSPCHVSAARLQQELRARADLAVRVVELGGADANSSFAQPAAKQHMQWAEGLPYFVVLNPKGKAIYKGSDLDAALAVLP